MIENKLKVIVTGASGYIGSLVVKDLLEIGSYEVVAIVRDENKKEKYEFLNQLKGAKELLSFAYGDLENADYSTIFKDAYAIIHTASPFVYSAEDPQRDIIQPAIRGNLRVLEAASLIPSIKKVIITSSTAAIVDLTKKKEVYNEDDWNDSIGENVPYPYSKTMAEKEAWKYIEKNGKQHYQLTFINPSLVFGPSVNSSNLSTSVALLLKVISDPNASSDPTSQRTLGIIDIRDVSKALIKVLTSSDDFDKQRYSMATAVLNFKQITEIIKEIYPNYQITPITIHHQQPAYRIESKSKVKLDSLIDIKTSLKDTIDWLVQTNKFTPIII